MYAHTLPSGAHYHCRSTGTYVGCGLGAREDALLPWGRSLMEWLESQPHPDLAPELRQPAGGQSGPRTRWAQWRRTSLE